MPGSSLPPDIREKMGHAPPRGVGGGASENVTTAHQRDAAMNPDAPLEEVREESSPKEEKEFVVSDKCPSASCRKVIDKEWKFCAACGQNILNEGLASKLGIKLGEEDLSDYLFKGYITRDIKILGKHKATMKSGQPKDLEAIDNYIMNGSWGKDDDGNDRKISDFFMRQVNAMCQTAACVVKVDGESIGETLDERMAWLKERGSSFVDILSQKVSWYNQALTEFLNDEDTVMGS